MYNATVTACCDSRRTRESSTAWHRAALRPQQPPLPGLNDGCLPNVVCGLWQCGKLAMLQCCMLHRAGSDTTSTVNHVLFCATQALIRVRPVLHHAHKHAVQHAAYNVQHAERTLRDPLNMFHLVLPGCSLYQFCTICTMKQASYHLCRIRFARSFECAFLQRKERFFEKQTTETCGPP